MGLDSDSELLAGASALYIPVSTSHDLPHHRPRGIMYLAVAQLLKTLRLLEPVHCTSLYHPDMTFFFINLGATCILLQLPTASHTTAILRPHILPMREPMILVMGHDHDLGDGPRS